MNEIVRRIALPLHLAGLVSVAAVGVSFLHQDIAHAPLHWVLLSVFALCTVGQHGWPEYSARRIAVVLLEVACALGLAWLAPRQGTAPVLLVMVVAQLSMLWPPRVVLVVALLLDAALYVVLRANGFTNAGLIVAVYLGFQGFAALIGYYARTAWKARDALALVNADLLATRALLADSARDAERLRVARELHDVAGHKLTAMKLNLRALAGDPALAERSEVRIAQQLSSELLDDIRQVVQALRDTRGLDLQTALRALAAPMPRPALQLSIAQDATVTDPALAETLLRIVQEALTNAARHADADTLFVQLTREGDALLLQIEDDGQRSVRLREGNGLSGMRERIAAAHGHLELDTNPRGALRIAARIPA
ncbi:Signal transduction histidine kinase [Pseudoxanthomonas sp. GM95]|uniref:sensor histidine kinase n=1 Tax=Pseudoxanthomonas sp. GM95 TaxID=1881043 RepID=UPI0008AC9B8C|nr:histidine kinase [Pseudoxanthomonas sp. GM95]SEM24329.1 Signal transduction histidine kinase [Pseudoxanthomonas sp. GM95]